MTYKKDTFLTQSCDWLAKHGDEEEYKDKWIIMTGNFIIATGDTLEELRQKHNAYCDKYDMPRDTTGLLIVMSSTGKLWDDKQQNSKEIE